MPWRETCPMDERVRFIVDLESAAFTMSELCAVYGISRKTGYKWAQRYLEEGWDGLKDRSRAPHSCPHRTDPEYVEWLLAERRSHPRWGARKLLTRLKRRHPELSWPSASTATAILKRHGLVTPRRRRRPRSRIPPPERRADAPNDLWSTDFKGEFRVGTGQWCYPLTVADRASRYLLACDGKPSTASRGVVPSFERLFVEYGLPWAILSDTGVPFGNARAPRRLSRLAVWWIRLGIEPIYSQPGCPGQNGGHERMHRTLKAETARPPAADATAQQARLDRFRQEFNQERPHEALGMQYPAERYRSSPRRYPRRLPELEYPGHCELRKVSSAGTLKWRGQTLYVSEVFDGEIVSLEEIDDGLWSVCFGPLLLGRYDERDEALELL